MHLFRVVEERDIARARTTLRNDEQSWWVVVVVGRACLLDLVVVLSVRLVDTIRYVTTRVSRAKPTTLALVWTTVPSQHW